jgi:hypothetical protein
MRMTNTGSALVVSPISRRRSVRGGVHLTQAFSLNQSIIKIVTSNGPHLRNQAFLTKFLI